MAARPALSLDQVDTAFQGRYRLHSPLRAGSQGIVFRAERGPTPHGTSAEEVALKLYFDPAQDNRVEREVRAMERMRHPSLADLIEHGTVEIDSVTYPYVAWEFIEGQPLDRRLLSGPAAPKLVATIGRDVATAIDQIWRHQIVHRDISPKNIMLRAGDGEAVLIDLGLARHVSQEALTTLGTTWGTMGYLSPEQCRAERQLTCACDVFAVGVVLQEALVGHHPTGGDQRRLLAEPASTTTRAPLAPVALAILIDRMLALRPAFRPHPIDAAEEFRLLAEQL